MDSGMCTQKSLGLPYRFESPHPSLPHPRRLVRLLCPIIGVLGTELDTPEPNCLVADSDAALGQ